MKLTCNTLFLLACLLTCATPMTRAEETTGVGLNALLQNLRQPGSEIIKGKLHVHSAQVLKLLKDNYTPKDLSAIEHALQTTLELRVNSRGLVKASDRSDDDNSEDPTHYDAVWVRDSLWVYLGLQTEAATANQMLLALLDYFSSPDQIQRFEHIIQDPKTIDGPDGPMHVVHIRFDGKSPTFQDVTENGQPQRWNHKQNDALGLFLDLFCRAILDGSLDPSALTPERAKAIGLFPAYFSAIRFYEMPDAGAWEEIERVNTSSIALVTSGLERLSELLTSHAPSAHAAAARFGASIDRRQLATLIDRGYARIRKQLAAGGESPIYPASDPHYRKADAALLNVIYPARLTRLTRKDFDRVLAALEPLIGQVGIKRYLNDSYQSGNFWFADSNTNDTSSAQSFADRGKRFLPDSEAQWFFDSWYSTAAGILFSRYHDAKYRAFQIRFLNRALAQITGGTPQKPVLGADGKPVKPMALPESYNSVVDPRTHERFFAPSPITPLNWSKASLRLALRQARRGGAGARAGGARQ